MQTEQWHVLSGLRLFSCYSRHFLNPNDSKSQWLFFFKGRRWFLCQKTEVWSWDSNTIHKKYKLGNLFSFHTGRKILIPDLTLTSCNWTFCGPLNWICPIRDQYKSKGSTCVTSLCQSLSQCTVGLKQNCLEDINIPAELRLCPPCPPPITQQLVRSPLYLF